MDNKNDLNFKPVKTLSEQIEHLENNKSVTFSVIPKIDAEEILYTHCYINVITPFKIHFAEKDKKSDIPYRDKKGNHIYPRKVEFSEYYKLYENERKKYPIIFISIMKFESAFRSILSYEVEQYYHLDTEDNIKAFFDDLHSNSIKYLNSHPKSASLVQHMQDNISNYYQKLLDFNSVYVFLDRLMLNDLVTIFRCCNENVRSKIFKNLLSRELTFGYQTFKSFDLFLSKIVQIRNYVCHFSSLEILMNYKDFKHKTLRHKSQRDSYEKAILKLSQK